MHAEIAIAAQLNAQGDSYLCAEIDISVQR